MPQLINLPTYGENGSLSVFEKILPNDIKRVFYIYDVPAEEQRAKHGHRKTWNALIALNGSCRIQVTEPNQNEQTFILSSPRQCLIIQPGEWHIMDNFSEGAILLVMSSEYYDKNDYFFDKP